MCCTCEPFEAIPQLKGTFFSSIPGAGVSGITTQEEQLAEVLRPFGDLVAIGRAGEQLPTPGAARIYASDAEWKSRQASDAGNSTRIKQGQRRGKSSLGAEASC